MLCRVEMPNNEQIFGRFCRWRLIHEKTLFTFLLPLILAGMATVLLIGGGLPIYIPLVLVALVAAWYVYILFGRPHQAYQKRSGAALLTEVTIFTENGFTRSVRSEEGGVPEGQSAQYSVLVRAVETGADFYLFTSPTQAYLIDKDYFTKGEPEELSRVLQARLGKKYTGPKHR